MDSVTQVTQPSLESWAVVLGNQAAVSIDASIASN